MLILGIETSCDDTALALVEGTRVLGSVRRSQLRHSDFGGVVPELAARAHQEHWHEVLNKLFVQSKKTWEDIDLIAVTVGPGLSPALLTGTTLGSYWSLLYGKPLIGVHHILGHILSVDLERENQESRRIKNLENSSVTQPAPSSAGLSSYSVTLPALVLTVSGGHTELHLRKPLPPAPLPKGEGSIIRLGQTLDDAAGEAFDKVAKMLGLGYPGGPEVSNWAEKGDINAFKLPRIYIDPQSLDFSFSGLKAAVRRIIEERYPQWLDQLPVTGYQLSERSTAEQKFISDLCASFQHAVFLIFKKKIERCLERYPEIRQVHFVGGVSANEYIRTNLELSLRGMTKSQAPNPKQNPKSNDQNYSVTPLPSYSVDLLTPTKLEYCTDNGAMIALAGGWLYERDSSLAKVQHVEPNPRIRLEDFLGKAVDQ